MKFVNAVDCVMNVYIKDNPKICDSQSRGVEYIGFLGQSFGSRGAAGVASLSRCQKLPPHVEQSQFQLIYDRPTTDQS